MGFILDTAAISHTVAGTSCEELEMRVNMGLLRPFIVPGKVPPLCPLSCNGAISLATALAHTYILSHELPSPPHLLPCAEKDRAKDRERNKEIGENF
jgi:hypothetical protein